MPGSVLVNHLRKLKKAQCHDVGITFIFYKKGILFFLIAEVPCKMHAPHLKFESGTQMLGKFGLCGKTVANMAAQLFLYNLTANACLLCTLCNMQSVYTFCMSCVRFHEYFSRDVLRNVWTLDPAGLSNWPNYPLLKGLGKCTGRHIWRISD